MEKIRKYFRCSKCGQTMYSSENTTKDTIHPMCTEPMAVRTSGICGGSISKEITKEEYDAQLKTWEENRNKSRGR